MGENWRETGMGMGASCSSAVVGVPSVVLVWVFFGFGARVGWDGTETGKKKKKSALGFIRLGQEGETRLQLNSQL